MTDLRDLVSPTQVSLDLREEGVAIPSQIDGRIYQTKYSRALWRGVYQWREGHNLEEVAAHIRDNEGLYIVPLWLTVGEYTGSIRDWAYIARDEFTVKDDLPMGTHIQIADRCCRITGKVSGGQGFVYNLNPMPVLPLSGAVTNKSFYCYAWDAEPFRKQFNIRPHIRLGDLRFEFTEQA